MRESKNNFCRKKFLNNKLNLKKQSLIRKNKKKQADIINKEAMQMAVATKIGGIKPMNFVEPAVGTKRLKVLNRALSKEIGTKIKLAIIK